MRSVQWSSSGSSAWPLWRTFRAKSAGSHVLGPPNGEVTFDVPLVSYHVAVHIVTFTHTHAGLTARVRNNLLALDAFTYALFPSSDPWLWKHVIASRITDYDFRPSLATPALPNRILTSQKRCRILLSVNQGCFWSLRRCTVSASSTRSLTIATYGLLRLYLARA